MWKPITPYLILAAVSALYLYPFLRGFNDAPDSGIYLNGANLVRHGAVPSRDFVELQAPGSFVWLALFFRLFGTTLETARMVLEGTGVALGLLAFWLSRRLGGTGFFAAVFVVMTSIPVLPMNSPHYDSNLFGLAALALFVTFRDGAGTGRLIAAAALCGFTTWTLQQKGLYLACALLGCLLWQRAFKPAFLFAVPYLATAALPFVVFAALHALPDVWYANYLWPLSTYSRLNAAPYGYPLWQNLTTMASQQGNQPVAWLEDVALSMPFLLAAILPLLLPVTALMAGRKWLARPVLPYWLAAYALWLAELHRADMGHLRNGVLLMAVLFFTVCECSGNSFLRRTALAMGICIALSGASHFLLTGEGQKRMTRRGEMRVKENAAVLDFLDHHTRAGEEVFVYPYQPIYYFVEDLRNPTRYSNLMYGMNTDAQFREAVADLDRKEVRYVLFDQFLSGKQLSRVFPAYRQPDPSQLILEPYLERHYRLANDFGRFRILERR